MTKLSDKEKWEIVNASPEAPSGGLPEQDKNQTLQEIGLSYLIETVVQLSSDSAADFLRSFDAPVRTQILNGLPPEKVRDLVEILSYPAKATGSVMAKEYMAIPENLTVEEAIAKLHEIPLLQRGHAPYVYIVNTAGEPAGVLQTRDLIFNCKEVPVKDIMTTALDTVSAKDPQERTARLLQEKKYLALPVVDPAGRLTGVVSASSVIQMIKEQADKDIAKMVGTGAEEMKSPSVLKILQLRMPWLFFSIASGLACAFITEIFQHGLQTVAVLFLFIPMVLGLSESTGIQGATIVVRNLTMGRFSAGDLKDLFFKEICVGIVIGLICGMIVGAIASFWQQNALLGVAIAVSMNMAIIISALVGLLLPLVFKALRIDPAMASGPLVLALCDLQTLAVYFNLAGHILNHY
jgi:magnesium transporter